MKRIARTIAAGIVAASCAASMAHAEMKSITIGTNPSGSTFFLIGGAFAKLFQEELGIRSTAQPNAGSSVYLPMIEVGDMTLGVSSTVDASMAYRGDGYPIEAKKLRAIASVWKLPYAYIVTGDSGIEKMEDLKGKRVMGNMPTNVALTSINKVMLEGGGLDVDDVDFAQSGGLLDGIKAVVEGRADAAPVATAMPVLVESNQSAPGGLRIVSNGAAASDDEFYSSRVPGTRVMTVKPSERTPFIVGETEILSYDTYLVASSDMSDDDAYLLAKTLHENWEQLQKDYGPFRGVAKDELGAAESDVPYHPGAIRFYKEAGIWNEGSE